MTTATRTGKYTKATLEASQVLYLAFESGVDEWKIGFTTDLRTKARVRVIPARDLTCLAREVKAAKQWFALPERVAVRSGYEAGRDGCWLHRHLATVGIAHHMVDSASIEVNRRQRRAKSDGLDVRKRLVMLLRYHAGERKVWSVLRVPPPEEEDRRQLHREWDHLQFVHTKILELERQRSRAIKHDRGEVADRPSAASTDRRWFEAIRPDQARQAASDPAISVKCIGSGA